MRLKEKTRDILRVVFSAAISACVFLMFVFGFIKLCEKTDEANYRSAETKQSKIPYSKEIPENITVSIRFFDGSKTLAEFDFKNLRLILKEGESKTKADRYLNVSENSAAEIIDGIGGIEIRGMRLTGVQAAEQYKCGALNKKQIIEGFFKKAPDNLTESKISDILNSCETDITALDAYYWGELIPKLCKNASYN